MKLVCVVSRQIFMPIILWCSPATQSLKASLALMGKCSTSFKLFILLELGSSLYSSEQSCFWHLNLFSKRGNTVPDLWLFRKNDKIFHIWSYGVCIRYVSITSVIYFNTSIAEDAVVRHKGQTKFRSKQYFQSSWLN